MASVRNMLCASGREWRLVRAALARLAVIALAWTAVPAVAQTERPDGPTGAGRNPMTFRLAEGTGAAPHTRWIVASGRIVTQTPRVFEAFRKANRIDGLPIALESRGGNVSAALTLARQWRQMGVTTLVGRTVERTAGGTTRQHLVTAGAECYSSCVLLLMGGRSRAVAATARIGVHQFGYVGSAEEIRARTWSGTDFSNAQRLMGEIAVFHQEMGVDLRLLQVASSVPNRAPIRILTSAEIERFQLASLLANERDRPGLVEWSLSERQDEPLLYRTVTVEADDSRRIDLEARLECSQYQNFTRAEFRLLLVHAEGEAENFALTRLRLVGGSEDYLFQTRTGLSVKAPRGSAWMRRDVPTQVFTQAAVSRSMALEMRGPGLPGRPLPMYDASFADAFTRFETLCARRGPRFIGHNPKH